MRCLAVTSSLSFRKKAWPCALDTRQKYLVSDRSGIYLITPHKIQRIIRGSCFGMSISDDRFLYYTLFFNFFDLYKMSFLVKVHLDRLVRKKITFSKVVYRREEYSIGSRIHQIEWRDKKIYIANSGNNTVLVLDSTTGKKIREFAPFKDLMNKNMIGYDLHHINSVAVFGDKLLFTAFNIRGGCSVIGLISSQDIELYTYPHEGVHDIAVINNNLFISDSFGGRIPRQGQKCDGGFPVKNGQKYLSAFFTGKQYMVRGICYEEGELVIGLSSLFRKEEDMGKKKGGLCIFRGDKETMYENLPFSQCYDMLNLKGFKIASENRSVDPEKITKLLEQSFGLPFQTLSAHEVTIEHSS